MLEAVFITCSQTQEYLIFGESGSLTKIISKIKKGFAGLVVLKTNNYNYIQKMLCLDLFSQFWLADKPNIFIHPVWDYLSNQSLSLHPKLGIHAANVAPEFGVVETKGLIEILKE